MLSRYAGAQGLFALALAVRLALLSLDAHLAFATFLPAMVLAMYLCGHGPGSAVAVLSAEQVIGKLGRKDFFAPEVRAEFQRESPIFLAQGHIGPLEFDLLGRDGSRRRVRVSATAVKDATGTFARSHL